MVRYFEKGGYGKMDINDPCYAANDSLPTADAGQIACGVDAL